MSVSPSNIDPAWKRVSLFPLLFPILFAPRSSLLLYECGVRASSGEAQGPRYFLAPRYSRLLRWEENSRRLEMSVVSCCGVQF
uniref:Uncharacterized protein n=1 Tax=Caenorhabditis japonica TaxID=281687 RepID=A0A8R1IRA7_CAEJA